MVSKGFLSGLAWGGVAFALVFGLIALFGPRPDIPVPDADPQRADAPLVRLSEDTDIAIQRDQDARSAPDGRFSLQGIVPPAESEAQGTTQPGTADADAVVALSEPSMPSTTPSDVGQGDTTQPEATQPETTQVEQPMTPEVAAAPTGSAPVFPLLRPGGSASAPTGPSTPTLGVARDLAVDTPPAELPRLILQPDLPGAQPPEVDTAAPAAQAPASEPDTARADTGFQPGPGLAAGLTVADPPTDISVATIGLPDEPGSDSAADGDFLEAATPDAAPETQSPVTAALPRTTLPRTGLTPFEGVRTNRLPTVAGPDTAQDTVSLPSDVTDTDMFDMALPAYLRFAQPYENPRLLPLMAIVLVDDGIPAATRELIADLPFVLTVAIDPTLPDAAAIVETYRAAGKEVAVLATALPARASASDIDVTFSSHFAAVPHAVAVMDVAGAGFQGNRAVSQLVVPVLAADGHGLITYNRGLNAAAQVAQAAGLAQTQVFRDLDEDAPNPFLLRRYLDRAAFEAVRDGQVVVTGRASYAPTLEAILSWRMEGRASDVALAPISAALRN